MDLRPSIERYFELSLFAMVVTGFVSVSATGKLDPLSLLLVSAALVWRGHLFWKRSALNLSVETTTKLTLFYVCFYIADFFFLSRSFVTASVHLVLFLLVTKMFSVHRDRDHIYLAVISFLMLLAAAVLTVDSFFLAAFVVYTLLAVSTFISMEMRRSLRQHAVPRADSNVAAPGGRQAAGVERRLAKSLSLAAAVIVAAIALGAPVMFYGLPRLTLGRLTELSGRNNFVSGFSDDVKLGAIGRIQQSDDVVMHVQFSERTRVPADLKFRGVTLGQFDGKRWFNRPQEAASHAFKAGEDQVLRVQSATLRNLLNGIDTALVYSIGNVADYRVTMEPIGTNVFFLVTRPASLTGKSRDYQVDGGGSVGYNDPTRQVLSYWGVSVHKGPDLVTRALRPDLATIPRNIADAYLQLPPLDVRIPALAADVTRNATSAFDKAAAIETYLQSNFAYTLQLESAGEDPLAYFLFRRKRGHCEYFASAMAVMLRSIGIPSRIANGFRGGELNDVSGSYVVRARDAHSWVEAYLPGYGWAEFDPTPAADPPPPSAFARLLLYVDAMREFWAEWVINYDFARQTSLGETTVTKSRITFDRLRMWVRANYDHMISEARQTQQWAASHPASFGKWGAAFLVALLLLANLRSLLRMVFRARIARRPARQPRAAAAIWYERMCGLLRRRRGIEKRASQTAEEFAGNIATVELRSRVTGFTEEYERARFGGSAEAASRLPELYDEVEAALKK